jgi:hypothetical protein
MLVLLIVKQLAKRQLLFRAALQHQQHSLHGQRCRRSSQIEFFPGQRMCVPLQGRQLRLVHRFRNQRMRRTQHLRSILCPPGSSKSQNENSNPHQRVERQTPAGKRSPERDHTHLD